MTDIQIENTNEEILEDFPLEGDVFLPSERYHDFKTFSALIDFAQVFRIYNGKYGQLRNGMFRLVYNTSQE